jgi:hypothetical protein
MAERALTRRQETALCIAANFGVTPSIQGSMPSLERRGLVRRAWVEFYGRRFRDWEVTPAGRLEVKRIRERDKAATAVSS